MTAPNPDCFICQTKQHPQEDASGHRYHIAHGGYGIACPATKEEYENWSKAISDPASRWEFD